MQHHPIKLALLLILLWPVSAWAVIAEVGADQQANNAEASCSSTFAFGSRTFAAGSTGVVMVADDFPSSSVSVSITDNNGGSWSCQAGDFAQTDNYVCYAANHASGATVVTVHYSGGISNCAVAASLSEWSGIGASVSVDVVKNANGSGTGISTGTSGTTATANELVLAMAGINKGATTVSAGPTNSFTGLTRSNTTNFIALFPAFKIVSSTGTQSTAWTSSDNSTLWGTLLVSLEATPPTPTPTATPTPTTTATPTATPTCSAPFTITRHGTPTHGPIAAASVTITVPAGITPQRDTVQFAALTTNNVTTTGHPLINGWSESFRMSFTGSGCGLGCTVFVWDMEPNPGDPSSGVVTFSGATTGVWVGWANFNPFTTSITGTSFATATGVTYSIPSATNLSPTQNWLIDIFANLDGTNVFSNPSVGDITIQTNATAEGSGFGSIGISEFPNTPVPTAVGSISNSVSANGTVAASLLPPGNGQCPATGWMLP